MSRVVNVAGMQGLRPLAIIAVVIGAVLFVVDMQGPALVYRRLLCTAVLVIAVVLAVIMLRAGLRGWAAAFAVVAVAFLPFYSMAMWIWWIIDGAAIVVFVAAALLFRGPPPAQDEDLPERFL